MPKQLDLVDESGLNLNPAEGHSEPRLWVRKLKVWKTPAEEIREIDMRPGLNIVWSPDPADKTETSTDAHVLGHGSGKTLFCRLLRYCLGEPHFASDEGRYRVSNAMPDGLVGAEIILDGVAWAVVRPIGNTRQHFAVPGQGLEDIVKGTNKPTGIDPFLEAVATRILTEKSVQLMPCKPFEAWPMALAWLSRDQECRFDKLLDWRSLDSESGSPVRGLSATKQLEVLRVLIGAINPAEIHLRGEIELMENRHRDMHRDISQRSWETERLRSRILSALELTDADIPAGRLGIHPLRDAAKSRLAQLATVRPGVDVSSLKVLREEVDAKQQRCETLRRELAQVEARIPEINAHIGRIKGEIPGGSADVVVAGNPVCPVCEVPIDQALAEGCKLSHKLPNVDELKARNEKRLADLAAEEERLKHDSDEQQRLRQELEQAQAAFNELLSSLKSAESARDARSDAWYKTRALIDDVSRLETLLVEEEETRTGVDAATSEIEEKRQRAGMFRDAQAETFARLSRSFDAIIRAVVSSNAKGRISLDGKGLKLTVELDGDRSTAAITSLKVIAFDLAVICLSMEGGIPLPAFLIHDSPREADLGLSLYHRLFSCVHGLERFSEPPLFQYILTTTTRPPEELLKKPWLTETLRGAPAMERLLRTDL
jgi:hypothetical protein